MKDNQIVENLSVVLYKQWDPLGLKKLGVKNQYRRYAEELVDRRSEFQDEEEIQKFLNDVFARIFGRPPKDGRASGEVASTIHALLRR